MQNKYKRWSKRWSPASCTMLASNLKRIEISSISWKHSSPKWFPSSRTIVLSEKTKLDRHFLGSSFRPNELPPRVKLRAHRLKIIAIFLEVFIVQMIARVVFTFGSRSFSNLKKHFFRPNHSLVVYSFGLKGQNYRQFVRSTLRPNDFPCPYNCAFARVVFNLGFRSFSNFKKHFFHPNDSLVVYSFGSKRKNYRQFVEVLFAQTIYN